MNITSPEPVQRRKLRQAAHLLILFLRQHPDLPPLIWTVAPDALHAHAGLCDVSDRNRQVFTTWAQALSLTDYSDLEPTDNDWDVQWLRAHGRFAGMPVFLTASLRPF
ncbi:MAG: hypothetical protein ACRD08_04465 [Acidimicrobiales bacterium]